MLCIFNNAAHYKQARGMVWKTARAVVKRMRMLSVRGAVTFSAKTVLKRGCVPFAEDSGKRRTRISPRK